MTLEIARKEAKRIYEVIRKSVGIDAREARYETR